VVEVVPAALLLETLLDSMVALVELMVAVAVTDSLVMVLAA
jgi:hypothetical protein